MTIFEPIMQTLAEITGGLIVVALVVAGGAWLWDCVLFSIRGRR